MDKLNKEIIALAIPSIVSNITVPLLGLVDVAVVGHIGDACYIGAIAVGSMMFNMIYWVFAFLRMGTSGMTAQAYGRSDWSEAVHTLIRAWVVGWGIALCFVVLQLPLREVALSLMNTPADVVPLVKTYFSIVIWGAPAMLGLYGLNGWFVGMQNTHIPMLVAIIQNVVNILLSVVLVFFFHLRIEGVALGTLIAQWCGFLIAAVSAYRLCIHMDMDLRNKSLLCTAVADRAAMVRFFTVNRDLFFRTLFLVAVNVFFTSAGARQGALILAANTLLMTFFMLYSYVQDGFANAGEALAGRYFAASDMQAFFSTIKRLVVWGGLFALLFTIIYMVFGKSILTILTSDNATVAMAQKYLWWTYLIPVAGLVAFVFDGVFIGITETRGMLLSSFTAAILFFLTYLTCFNRFGNDAQWLAFIGFLVGRGFVLLFVFNRKYR